MERYQWVIVVIVAILASLLLQEISPWWAETQNRVIMGAAFLYFYIWYNYTMDYLLDVDL